MRILVLEDNVLNMKLFRAVLERRGHVVLEALDVDQGRALLDADLDVALLDIQVPGGGGEALLEAIRASDRLRGLPVVAVTASAMQGDRERLLRVGFDAYVSKPIDTRVFAQMVEDLVAEHAASAPRRGQGDEPSQ